MLAPRPGAVMVALLGRSTLTRGGFWRVQSLGLAAAAVYGPRRVAGSPRADLAAVLSVQDGGGGGGPSHLIA